MLTHIMGRVAAARGRNGRNMVVTRWLTKPPRDAPDSAAGGYLGLHGAAAGASRPPGTGEPRAAVRRGAATHQQAIAL